MKDPILITGAARSGTSMVAGVIHLCGAWGGKMSGPTSSNKKGMFENAKIRNELVKPLLREWRCDPLGQNPLPHTLMVETYAEHNAAKWRALVFDILTAEGHKGEAWFYKGAKMCLMWPLWHKAFPQAQWVIVRRNAEDIVRSCLRTGFMRAFKNRSGWLSWVAEHEKRFEQMHDAKLVVREVWPQRMIDGDFTEIQMVTNGLGLTWKDQEVREFIAPELWKSSRKPRIP